MSIVVFVLRYETVLSWLIHSTAFLRGEMESKQNKTDISRCGLWSASEGHALNNSSWWNEEKTKDNSNKNKAERKAIVFTANK